MYESNSNLVCNGVRKYFTEFTVDKSHFIWLHKHSQQIFRVASLRITFVWLSRVRTKGIFSCSMVFGKLGYLCVVTVLAVVGLVIGAVWYIKRADPITVDTLIKGDDVLHPFKIIYPGASEKELPLVVTQYSSGINSPCSSSSDSFFIKDQNDALTLAFSDQIYFNIYEQNIFSAKDRPANDLIHSCQIFIDYRNNKESFSIKIKVNNRADRYLKVNYSSEQSSHKVELTESKNEAQLFIAKFVPLKELPTDQGIQFKLNACTEAGGADNLDYDMIYYKNNIFRASSILQPLTAVEANGDLLAKFSEVSVMPSEKFLVFIEDRENAAITYQKNLNIYSLVYVEGKMKLVQVQSQVFQVANLRALSKAQREAINQLLKP